MVCSFFLISFKDRRSIAGLNENRLAREVDNAKRRTSRSPGDFAAAASIGLHPSVPVPPSPPRGRGFVQREHLMVLGAASGSPGPSSQGSPCPRASSAHPRCEPGVQTRGACGWWSVGVCWGCRGGDSPAELPAAQCPPSVLLLGIPAF